MFPGLHIALLAQRRQWITPLGQNAAGGFFFEITVKLANLVRFPHYCRECRYGAKNGSAENYGENS